MDRPGLQGRQGKSMDPNPQVWLWPPWTEWLGLEKLHQEATRLLQVK
jgi:hypothetical protein